MKKQLVKDLKERFQLPGKIGLTLENLFGEKEKFLGETKRYVLNIVSSIVNSNYQLGTMPIYVRS